MVAKCKIFSKKVNFTSDRLSSENRFLQKKVFKKLTSLLPTPPSSHGSSITTCATYVRFEEKQNETYDSCKQLLRTQKKIKTKLFRDVYDDWVICQSCSIIRNVIVIISIDLQYSNNFPLIVSLYSHACNASEMNRLRFLTSTRHAKEM